MAVPDASPSAEPTELRLSSRLTLVMKFGIPAGCFLVAAGVAIGDIDHPLSAGLMALALGAFLLLFFPVKRVVAREHSIVVSNYAREIEIPYGQIERVRDGRSEGPLTPYMGMRGRMIQIVLREPCVFGRVILFLPTAALIFPWTRHPAATLLRRRAGLDPDAE